RHRRAARAWGNGSQPATAVVALMSGVSSVRALGTPPPRPDHLPHRCPLPHVALPPAQGIRKGASVRTAHETPERGARMSPIRRAGELTELGTVLGVWAHPDDETYLSGGLMAMAVANGQRVVTVSATAGDRGGDGDPWEVARVRRAELSAAMDALGV